MKGLNFGFPTGSPSLLPFLHRQPSFERRKRQAFPRKFDEPSQSMPFDDGFSDEALED